MGSIKIELTMIVARPSAATEANHDADGVAAAEVLVSLRRTTERWARQHKQHRITSGLRELDLVLGGGWPRGRVGELSGPVSSGHTGIAVASVAAATARGEVAAWIDAARAFDPTSVERAGVGLERVLWVRVDGVFQAVRAAELVLEAGGFSVVVLDLACRCLIDRFPHRAPAVGASPRTTCGTWWETGQMFEGERQRSLRLRLARATERAGAVALVLSERSWAGATAGVTVSLSRGKVAWGGDGHGPCWLSGFTAVIEVERGGVSGCPRSIELRLGRAEAQFVVDGPRSGSFPNLGDELAPDHESRAMAAG